MINIDLINRTSHVRDARFAALLPALQAQMTEDFCPVWRIEAPVLRLVGKARAPKPTNWKIWLLDTSDTPGDLGYHENDTGIPEAKIFVMDDMRYGAEVSVTISHELCEMMADPAVIREVVIDGRIYVIEVCDPVEADSDGYLKRGFLMSNFVTPTYFKLPGFTGLYDFLGQLRGPCPAVRPGGYLMWFKDGVWHTEAARHVEDGVISHRAYRPFGRSQRRAAPRG